MRPHAASRLGTKLYDATRRASIASSRPRAASRLERHSTTRRGVRVDHTAPRRDSSSDLEELRQRVGAHEQYEEHVRAHPHALRVVCDQVDPVRDQRVARVREHDHELTAARRPSSRPPPPNPRARAADGTRGHTHAFLSTTRRPRPRPTGRRARTHARSCSRPTTAPNTRCEAAERKRSTRRVVRANARAAAT